MKAAIKAQLEESSFNFANNLSGGILGDIVFWKEKFNQGTENSPNVQQVAARKIFQDTLITGAKKALNIVREELSDVDKVQEYKLKALKATSHILGAILDFEKKIDEKFPGASDLLLKAASYAITGLLSYATPVISTVIVCTGATSHLKDVFKKDNLQKYITSINDKIEKIEQTKQLSEMKEEAVSLAAVNEVIQEPVNAIQQLELKDKQGLDKFDKEPSEVKNFIKFAANYAKKTFKKSKKEIEKNIKSVREEIKKEGSKIVEEEVSKKIDNIMDEAKGTLEKSLSEKDFFKKVEDQQKVAEYIVKKVTPVIDKALTKKETDSKIINEVKTKISKIVNEKIAGDINTIAKPLSDVPGNIKNKNKVKKFVGKHFRIPHTLKLKFKKLVQSKAPQQISI